MANKATTLPVACFAPDLTDQKLARYESIISGYDGDPELKDALEVMFKCVKLWWDLPVSTRKDVKQFNIQVPTRDSSGNVIRDDKGAPIRKEVQFAVTPLEEAHVKSLWEATPWMRELVAMEPLLDSIDNATQKELRDCAYHLNWFCRELTSDREPLTQSALPAA